MIFRTLGSVRRNGVLRGGYSTQQGQCCVVGRAGQHAGAAAAGGVIPAAALRGQAGPRGHGIAGKWRHSLSLRGQSMQGPGFLGKRGKMLMGTHRMPTIACSGMPQSASCCRAPTISCVT